MTAKPMTKEDRLRKVPLFDHLSKKNLAEIARIADEVAVPAQKVLVKEGEYGDQFIIIVEGRAKVEKNAEVVNWLSENDFFGEVGIIANQPRAATVTAETDMKLLVVHRSHFYELVDDTPGMWKEIAVALSGYIPTDQ